MTTVTVSSATYSLLKRQADAEQRQPDKLANELANTVRWLQEFR